MATTIKVPCPRCDGKGVIPQYFYNRKGICFRCWGDKYVTIKVPDGKTKDEVLNELKKREAEDLASEKNKPKVDMPDSKIHKKPDYFKGANSKVAIKDTPKRPIQEVLDELNAERKERTGKIEDERDAEYLKSVIQRLKDATDHPNKQSIIDKLQARVDYLAKQDTVRKQMQGLSIGQLEELYEKLSNVDNPDELQKIMLEVAGELEMKKRNEIQAMIKSVVDAGNQAGYGATQEDFDKLIQDIKDKYEQHTSDYVSKQIAKLRRIQANLYTNDEVAKRKAYEEQQKNAQATKKKQAEDYGAFQQYLKDYVLKNNASVLVGDWTDEPADNFSLYHLRTLEQLDEVMAKARELMGADNPRLSGMEQAIPNYTKSIERRMKEDAVKQEKLNRLANKRFKDTDTAREVEKQIAKGFTTVKDVVAVGKIAGRGIVEGYIAKVKPLKDAKDEAYAKYKALEDEIGELLNLKDGYMQRLGHGQQALERISDGRGFPENNRYGWKNSKDIADDMNDVRDRMKELDEKRRKLQEESNPLYVEYREAERIYFDESSITGSNRKVEKYVVLDELTKVREFGGGTAKFDTSVKHTSKDYHSEEELKKQLESMTKEVTKFFPTSWLNEAGTIKVERGDTIGKGRSFYSGRYIGMGEYNYSTMMHEYAHHMQKVINGIHEKEMEFYRDRTGFKTMKRVAKHYDVDERYWTPKKNKPQWLHNYMGKTYHGRIHWKEYSKDNINGSEFLTMGIEELMNNPMRLYEHDEELFYYLIGVLAGV